MAKFQLSPASRQAVVDSLNQTLRHNGIRETHCAVCKRRTKVPLKVGRLGKLKFNHDPGCYLNKDS